MPALLADINWGPLIPFGIFFVFLTLSILHATWKRAQRGQEDGGSTWIPPKIPPDDVGDFGEPTIVRRYVRPASAEFPAPSAPSGPRPLSPWEQELERVLRGERRPAAPPPLPQYDAPPVPVIVSPAYPRPLPEPPLEAFPPLLSREAINESGDLEAADLESAPMPTAPLASLESAATAYLRGSTLDRRVAGEMTRVDQRIAHAAPTAVPVNQGMSPDLRALIAGLRRPATARQAIIASLILGKPRALET
jgi:hypothetical protein